ncbi:polysaccharide biosynthesis protein [Longibacter salinarum]|uniref:polysaccharide biosynthesis protein n=1 Tax=Longibacter salinarum TaxID=1850348 RepID=UPI001180D19F|nr:polysaccharide biosynthesis protein [Longibacter salinarum]
MRDTDSNFSLEQMTSALRLGQIALFAVDGVWVYVALALANYVRVGIWEWPQDMLPTGLVLLLTSIYLLAMIWGGAYQRPHALRFSEFARLAGGLAGAFLLSIAAAYLVAPSSLVPRGTAVIHALLCVIGLLGSRSGLRLINEWHRSGAPSTPPTEREPVTLDEFVDRPPVEIDIANLQDVLSDETVLVTGAGGSIGAELCEQLVRLHPERLILVDMCEYNLYRIQTRLGRRQHSVEMVYSITDVRDRSALERLFQRYNPGIVIHTAAYKHVPLMEYHPEAAFDNNTMTTVHLVDLCDTFEVDQFVFVSTDKAVEPKSVLGATKRLGEWYVQSTSTNTRCKIVRFGNVFGSQGSVVPLFEERLREGEPVPVTHPDMERYFMTGHEACSLILQTLLHDSHSVYLLRMGDPVRIEWLARKMVETYFPDVVTDRMIEYIGKRPGEKLSECLVTPTETMEDSDHPNVVGVKSHPPYSWSELQHQFETFKKLSREPHVDPSTLHELLFDAARLPGGDGQLGTKPFPSSSDTQ